MSLSAQQSGICAVVGLKDTGAMTAVNRAAFEFGESHKEQQVPARVEKAEGAQALTSCAALGIALAHTTNANCPHVRNLVQHSPDT